MKHKTLVRFLMTITATLLLSACGGGGGSSSVVSPPPPATNTPPTVSGPVMNSADDNDSAYTISTAELIANASDADGDILTVADLAIDSGDGSGVTLNATSVDVDPERYNAFRTGDSELIVISYSISDGSGGSVAATLELTIAGANDAPTRLALSNILLADRQPTTGGFRVGTLYIDDLEGDSGTFSIVGGADADVFSISGIELLIDDVISASDQDRYDITVRATDSEGASVEGEVSILVHSSPPLTIGYYDINTNAGRAEQATPISAIGETAVDVGDLDQADLSGMDMLFVQNPSTGAPSGPFVSQANLDKIANFVGDGGVLIFHDRYVDAIEDFLPGESGTITVNFDLSRLEFELVEPPTFVSQGPGGTIDNTNLESSNSLSYGFADATGVPVGSVGYLSRNDSNHWITYSYGVGFGHVIYSSIPLDFYLQSGAIPAIFREVYAPNILAQGRALRKKGVDIDNDGLLDVEESLLGTSPTDADTDADGMGDLYEVRNGLNPSDAGDAGRDPDADGLTNLEEFNAGTLPRLADSDRDGLTDGDEINIYATDPLRADTDEDLLTDFQEVTIDGTDPNVADTDTGGTDDGREVLVDGTDPLDPDDDLSSIALPITLNDVNGFIWDIQQDGSINNGSIDAYDGGMRLALNSISFGQFDVATILNDGREMLIGLTQVSGLNVIRRVYVPDDQAFARYLDVLSNPTNADIAVQLVIDTNLGSDSATVIVTTSDGDTSFEATDTWVVSDDASDGAGDPSLAHVIAGPGGSIAASAVTSPTGSLTYTYDVTVPANGRAIIMHFASQNANRTTAIASAGNLVGLGNGTLDNMSTEDMADVANFDLMQSASISRPALRVVAPMCEIAGACL